LIGALFRSNKTEKKKVNLMIFIRAEIMRDSADTAFQTNAKYNMIRDIQDANDAEPIQLMRNEQRPAIPPLSQEQINNSQRTESQDDGSE